MSKFVISDTLDTAVNARSVANFKVSIFSEIESSTGIDLTNLKTVSSFQKKDYLGRSGLCLNTPDMSAQTRGCLPAEISCIGS